MRGLGLAREHVTARAPTSHRISLHAFLVRTLLVPAHVMSHSPPLTLPSALVGEVDDEKDSTIDYTEIRAEPISEIRH